MNVEERAIKRELKIIAQWETKRKLYRKKKAEYVVDEAIAFGYEEIERIKSGHFVIGVCACGQNAWGWNNGVPTCEICQDKIFEEFEYE